MTKEIFEIIFYSQTALSALVALLCFIQFKQRHDFVKLIGLLFFLGFLANALAMCMFSVGYGKYVNIPQSIFTIVNFCLVCMIYYYVLGSKYKTGFLATGLIFVSFSLFNLIFLQRLQINSYNHILDSILTLLFSIYFFYHLLIELPSTHLNRYPMFWINSAFLIFNAGTLVLYVFTSYLVNVLKDNLLGYWSFHNLLSIAEHLLIIVGIVYDLKSRKAEEGNH